jgi:hypothetical protein
LALVGIAAVRDRLLPKSCPESLEIDPARLVLSPLDLET